MRTCEGIRGVADGDRKLASLAKWFSQYLRDWIAVTKIQIVASLNATHVLRYNGYRYTRVELYGCMVMVRISDICFHEIFVDWNISWNFF
jgi:hypothetical protein